MKELFFKSVAASFLIAMGVNVSLCIGGIAGAVFFAFGLLGVCSLGLNLFTGKCGYLVRRTITPTNLFLILVFNMLAGWGFGMIMGWANPSLIIAANEKIATWSMSPQYFTQSFMCGVIMWIAVEMYNRKGNTYGIIFGVPLFILCGFQHSIANIITLGVANSFNYIVILCILGNFLGSIFICTIAS